MGCPVPTRHGRVCHRAHSGPVTFAAGSCKVPFRPLEAPMSLKLQPVSVFGVPTDVGAGGRGASMGPETLRLAGLAEALVESGVVVFYRGFFVGLRITCQNTVA